MRVKHRVLVKLNEMTGLPKPYLCDLISTRKRPSYRRAIYLEEITGIHHDLWQGGNAEEIKIELNKNFKA